MNPIARGAAALAVAAIVVAGAAVYLGATGPNVGGQPTPVPTPTAMTSDSYRAARDAVCDAALAAANPIKARFVGDFSPSLDPAERTSWIAALIEYADRQSEATDAWAPLTPPAELAADHAELVRLYRDMNSRIRLVADNLDSGLTADAGRVDQSTDPLNAQILGLERKHQLHPCP